MVFQKPLTGRFVHFWVCTLIRLITRAGNLSAATKTVKQVLGEILKISKNLDSFFSCISKNMYLPVILRFRIVAGRKVYIPLRVEKSKELVYAIRLILKSLIKRNETQFHKRLIAELFDVYNNRGLSIKRRLELCNEITVNIPNFRFLKYRKKH